jgi:hypothetical protein
MNDLEEKYKELRKDHDGLLEWVSNIASLVQCLVEDRLEDDDMTQVERETFNELLKKI